LIKEKTNLSGIEAKSHHAVITYACNAARRQEQPLNAVQNWFSIPARGGDVNEYQQAGKKSE
jgi:hypothetical protein